MSIAKDVIREYLMNAPEQDDWPWDEHCDGLAGGILNALEKAGVKVLDPAFKYGPMVPFTKERLGDFRARPDGTVEVF